MTEAQTDTAMQTECIRLQRLILTEQRVANA